MDNIVDYLPALPSVDAAQSFLRFRFVPARTIVPNRSKTAQHEDKDESASGNDHDTSDTNALPAPLRHWQKTTAVPDRKHRRDNVSDLSHKPGAYIVYAAEHATMADRSGAIIQQTTRAEVAELVDPVMFAHASLAVWAKHDEYRGSQPTKDDSRATTWTSIVLLDPPFVPAHVSA